MRFTWLGCICGLPLDITCFSFGFEIHVDCLDVCTIVNKRLDDWISVDLMDLSKLEPPKKENKTPMKVMNGSRPSSPDREMVHFSSCCHSIATNTGT